MHGLALSSAGGSPAGAGGALFGLSLCAGAGGLDLGLHLAVGSPATDSRNGVGCTSGYRTVGYVERETYAAAILVARMEDAALDPAPVWDDVASFDGGAWRGAVDIVLAGYPCQPFSVAGRRQGAADPRHLWPHVARIVGECRAPFVFLENVAHHLRLGFPEVAGDLVDMGYRLAAGLFTAAEVGAPHRRERLFILAHRAGDGPVADPARLLGNAIERRQPDRVPSPLADPADRQLPLTGWGEARRAGPRPTGPRLANTEGLRRDQAERRRSSKCGPEPRITALDDANGARLEGWNLGDGSGARERPAWPPSPSDEAHWQEYLRRAPHLEPAVRRGADGLANRVDRLRLCGNGVVPLVAAHALRTLAAELADER